MSELLDAPAPRPASAPAAQPASLAAPGPRLATGHAPSPDSVPPGHPSPDASVPAAQPASVLTGGCLCGGVRYEVTPPVPFAAHCHCSRCRKWGGANCTAHMVMQHEHFRLVRGAELLRTYRTPNLAPRVFCTVCGSSLFTTSPTQPERPLMVVHMGTLDADPGVRPMLHEFVESMAPWDAITDDLPQMQEEPSAG